MYAQAQGAGRHGPGRAAGAAVPAGADQDEDVVDAEIVDDDKRQEGTG